MQQWRQTNVQVVFICETTAESLLVLVIYIWLVVQWVFLLRFESRGNLSEINPYISVVMMCTYGDIWSYGYPNLFGEDYEDKG